MTKITLSAPKLNLNLPQALQILSEMMRKILEGPLPPKLNGKPLSKRKNQKMTSQATIGLREEVLEAEEEDEAEGAEEDLITTLMEDPHTTILDSPATSEGGITIISITTTTGTLEDHQKTGSLTLKASMLLKVNQQSEPHLLLDLLRLKRKARRKPFQKWGLAGLE